MPALRGQEFYHPHALYLQHMHAVQNSTALMCPISPEKAAISQENKDIHVLTHTKKIPYLFTHFLKTQICMPWYDLKKAVFNNASPCHLFIQNTA